MLYSLLFTPLLALAELAAPAPAQLVVPGRSLGNLKLGADVATMAAYGPAAYGDNAMQKGWNTWFGTGHPPAQLDVYSTLVPGQDTHKTVQVVRATSTYFRLANGLRNGSTLHQVRECYGRRRLESSEPAIRGRPWLQLRRRDRRAWKTCFGRASAEICNGHHQCKLHLPRQFCGNDQLLGSDSFRRSCDDVSFSIRGAGPSKKMEPLAVLRHRLLNFIDALEKGLRPWLTSFLSNR
ncbi:MAG: hypothetical protein EOO81_10875 [Oxalobacteraceae bacterium]|nr:MAG: hypothetical protein EOO81_10875 [Oxalobacteraceae bacterium]